MGLRHSIKARCLFFPGLLVNELLPDTGYFLLLFLTGHIHFVKLTVVFSLVDLLKLKWTDVYDEEHQSFYTHVTLTEQKTGKTKLIALNKQVIGALSQCYLHRKGEFIFANNRKEPQAISRV